MRKTLTGALAGVLLLVAPAAEAACNIHTISGTWVVQVTRTVDDLNFPGPTSASTTCWFVISRPDNLGIHCDRAWLSEATDFFAQFQTDFPQGPWHKIVGPNRNRNNTTDTGRRFATPNRCQWQITDRNDIDIDYDVFFSPDMQSLNGAGRGYQDKHFGATEPLFVSFSGDRQ